MNISLIAPNMSSIDVLVKLVKDLFDYEALSQKVEQTTQAVTALLNNPDLGQAWLIQIEQQGEKEIVGHIIVSYSFSLEHGGRVAIIDQLYLKPAWRHQGIGTEILPRIEQQVIEAGALALSLEVNIGNAGARVFYEKHGFVPRRQYCMMTKVLNETADVPFHLAS